MSIETTPRIDLLMVGCCLTLGGLLFSPGIFIPKYRGRWGRSGRGARMSTFSQVLWAAMFILFGSWMIFSVYNVTWLDRVFPFVFFPLLATMFIMALVDGSGRKRNGKDAPNLPDPN